MVWSGLAWSGLAWRGRRQVSQIKEFLRLKLASVHGAITIVISEKKGAKYKQRPLSDSLTLEQIYTDLWPRAGDLVLHYLS